MNLNIGGQSWESIIFNLFKWKKKTGLGLYMSVYCRFLLVKEHICLRILNTGLRHLSNALVIELVPLLVQFIPTIGNIVTTLNKTKSKLNTLVPSELEPGD